MSKEVWILKRVKGKDLGVKLYKEIVKEGKKTTEEVGDYKGDGLPGAYDEIKPVWNGTEGEWAFKGTDKELQEFITKFKLRDKYNELIASSRRNDPADPFFTHDFFRKKPIIMYSTHVFKTGDLKQEFLRRCWQGAEKVKVYGSGEKLSPLDERLKKYLLILSSNVEDKEAEFIDLDLEAGSVLYNVTEDVLKLLGVILNLSLDTKMRPSVLKAKLKAFVDSKAKMTGFNNRFYGGLTEQEALIKYGKMSLGELNKRKRIITAIHKGILAFTRNGYKLYDNLFDSVVTLEQLVQYFEENAEMDEKIAKL